MNKLYNEIESSLKLLRHKTGKLTIRTNSNGAKHYNDKIGSTQAMDDSILCKDINDIIQQIQNTLDYTTSIQRIFNPNFEPLDINNVIISIPDNWITYLTVNYKFETHESTIALIYQ